MLPPDVPKAPEPPMLAGTWSSSTASHMLTHTHTDTEEKNLLIPSGCMPGAMLDCGGRGCLLVVVVFGSFSFSQAPR